MHSMRPDIQVLRAIAVLSVLIFHFNLPGLGKGFLGVDIFFVISGFLMSRVILDSLDQARFSASTFYLRRARRLLPAAWAVLLLTTLAAPWVLGPAALRDYAAQLGGAMSFSANIVLWQQSGYFDSSADLKPLLHTWSLALEEQYYFVLPLVLIWAGQRWRGWLLLALALASAGLCLWLNDEAPSASFYLLPSRAWELILGSLCALPAVRERVRSLPARIDSAWLALPIMASSLIWGWDEVHPRTDALLVCLATAILILWPSAALSRSHLVMRTLGWVGDVSYSLYLVHWPVLALARHVWLDGLPASVSWALLVLIFPLAWLSHRLVEQPFRKVDTWPALGRQLLWLGVPLLVTCAVLFWRIQQPEGQQWAQVLQPNFGLGPSCEFEAAFAPKPGCQTREHAHTLVWGDSYAMHLIGGIRASSPHGQGVIQATRSVCAPLLDMARLMPDDPADRARRCLAFNESVLQWLAHAPEVEYVVLSSRWQYLFDDPVVNAQGQFITPDANEMAASLGRTVARLHALHKKVVVVSPPPSLGADVDLGVCAERLGMGLLTTSERVDQRCRFALSAARQSQSQVTTLMGLFPDQADVDVIDLADFNCHQGLCESVVAQTPIYRDAGHLSQVGSTRMGMQMNLGQRIVQQAH